jgi:hemerythrin-like domain-containing protein
MIRRKDNGTDNSSPVTGNFALSPVDMSVFERPLDHLAMENARLVRVCDHLDTISTSVSRLAKRAAPVLTPYLRWDYPRHFDWIEQDLFTALEASSFVGDPVHEPMAQLTLEQAVDRKRAARLAGLLAEYGGKQDEEMEKPLSYAAACFAEAQRRHVAWLDTVLFPIAQERLTASDLKWLSKRLKERYGARRDEAE